MYYTNLLIEPGDFFERVSTGQSCFRVANETIFSNDVQDSLADLKALSRIINESIAQIERIAVEKNLKFPSIDVPYSEESEVIRKDDVVVEATFNIVSAATRLLAVARPAPHSVLVNSLLVRI